MSDVFAVHKKLAKSLTENYSLVMSIDPTLLLLSML